MKSKQIWIIQCIYLKNFLSKQKQGVKSQNVNEINTFNIQIEITFGFGILIWNILFFFCLVWEYNSKIVKRPWGIWFFIFIWNLDYFDKIQYSIVIFWFCNRVGTFVYINKFSFYIFFSKINKIIKQTKMENSLYYI